MTSASTRARSRSIPSASCCSRRFRWSRFSFSSRSWRYRPRPRTARSTRKPNSSSPWIGRTAILTILLCSCGIHAGEYTVNVSHFVATTGAPVPVTVKVQKLNPTAQVIFDDTVFVDHTGDEKTAVRFTLDSEGKVIDVSRRPKSLMETFRNVRQNGADRDPKTGYVKQL